MPQVQLPDTGEGSGCGRLSVYLATHCVVLESKADMQKRGQASPDDGDSLALTFAQPVEPAKSMGRTRRRNSFSGSSNSGGCDDHMAGACLIGGRRVSREKSGRWTTDLFPT
jgi:hypothetical protein